MPIFQADDRRLQGHELGAIDGQAAIRDGQVFSDDVRSRDLGDLPFDPVELGLQLHFSLHGDLWTKSTLVNRGYRQPIVCCDEFDRLLVWR